MDKLVEIGRNLLKKPVSRVEQARGQNEPIERVGTNEDALKRFARLLSEERRYRQTNNSRSC